MKLIDKDALVAEILRRRRAIPKNETDKALRAVYGNEAFVLTELLSFLDTLEVIEVDLEEELIDYHNENFNPCDDGTLLSTETGAELAWYDYECIARHFFKLGLTSSLSWQDIKLIAEIGDKFMNSEESDNLSEEEYYIGILNKFKAQKGEVV